MVLNDALVRSLAPPLHNRHGSGSRGARTGCGKRVGQLSNEASFLCRWRNCVAGCRSSLWKWTTWQRGYVWIFILYNGVSIWFIIYYYIYNLYFNYLFVSPNWFSGSAAASTFLNFNLHFGNTLTNIGLRTVEDLIFIRLVLIFIKHCLLYVYNLILIILNFWSILYTVSTIFV